MTISSEIFLGFLDHRPARVGVFFLKLIQLVFDDGHATRFRRQNSFQLFNQFECRDIFILDLLPFQSGQAGQPHLENGIDIVQRDLVPLENMRALLGFVEIELCAPDNHLMAMVDIFDKHLFQAENFWDTMDQRQHHDGEGGLHLRVFI